jgi:hypothetical protein
MDWHCKYCGEEIEAYVELAVTESSRGQATMDGVHADEYGVSGHLVAYVDSTCDYEPTYQLDWEEEVQGVECQNCGASESELDALVFPFDTTDCVGEITLIDNDIAVDHDEPCEADSLHQELARRNVTVRYCEDEDAYVETPVIHAAAAEESDEIAAASLAEILARRGG